MTDDNYVVTLFGTVHVSSCSEVKGMKWVWEGVNNLVGDTPCSACVPDGLPDRTPYEFTESEIDKLKSILNDNNTTS